MDPEICLATGSGHIIHGRKAQDVGACWRMALALGAALGWVIASSVASLAQPVSFNTAANYPTGDDPQAVAVGDLNQDGNADLAIASTGGHAIFVLLGDGTGGFGAATNLPLGAAPLSVAIADVNGDGKPDLLAADMDSDAVSVLLGMGAGAFGPPTHFPVGDSPYAVAISDVNADGRLDLVVADFFGDTVSVLWETAPERSARP